MRFLLPIFTLWFAGIGLSEETVSLTPYTVIAEQRTSGTPTTFLTVASE